MLILHLLNPLFQPIDLPLSLRRRPYFMILSLLSQQLNLSLHLNNPLSIELFLLLFGLGDFLLHLFL